VPRRESGGELVDVLGGELPRLVGEPVGELRAADEVDAVATGVLLR
jgi:hypothetical protein